MNVEIDNNKVYIQLPISLAVYILKEAFKDTIDKPYKTLLIKLFKIKTIII